jgi:hypothetical protein
MLPGVILDCVFDYYFEALCRNHLGEVKEKRNLRANFSSGCRDVMSIVTRQYPGVADNFCSPQCPNREIGGFASPVARANPDPVGYAVPSG